MRFLPVSYQFSVIFLFIISVFSVVMLSLLFWPITVIRPNLQPYKIISSKVVHPGETVIYEVDACKDRTVTSVVKRQIVVEGVIYDLPPTQNNVPEGCGKTHVGLTIPEVIPTGDAYIDLTITYHINVLRDQTFHFKTEDFVIVPK